MAYKLIYSYKAEKDVENTIKFYDIVASKKIAKAFQRALLNAEETLKKTAFFEKIYQDFHRLPLKVFPYILIYKIEKEKEIIKIYRVFHTSQNPEKYPKK